MLIFRTPIVMQVEMTQMLPKVPDKLRCRCFEQLSVHIGVARVDTDPELAKTGMVCHRFQDLLQEIQRAVLQSQPEGTPGRFGEYNPN